MEDSFDIVVADCCNIAVEDSLEVAGCCRTVTVDECH